MVSAVACVSACTSTHPERLSHSSSPTSPTVSTSSRTHGATGGAVPAWYAQCLARKPPGGKAVPFRGTSTPTHYCGIVWNSDVVHDCGRYAYGAAVVAFVHRHRCGAIRRVLATVYVGGVAVNVSSVVTSFAGTATNPYGAEYTFGQLARSRRAGGIADLLRAGHRIPGPHGRPPANAHYGVYPFNTQVDILDSWYRTPPAHPRLWSLKRFDQDLSFSRLTG